MNIFLKYIFLPKKKLINFFLSLSFYQFPTTETSTGRLCRPCKCPHHKVSSHLLLLSFRRWPQDSPSPRPSLSPRPSHNLNQIVEDQLSRRPISRSRQTMELLLLLNSTPQLLSPEVMLLLLLSQTTQQFRRRTMPNPKLIPLLLLLLPLLNTLLPPPMITPHPRTKVRLLPVILQEDLLTLQQKKIRLCTALRPNLINPSSLAMPQPRRPAMMIAMPSARMTTIEPR